MPSQANRSVRRRAGYKYDRDDTHPERLATVRLSAPYRRPATLASSFPSSARADELMGIFVEAGAGRASLDYVAN